MCVVCEVRITVVAVMESLLPGLALPEAGEEEVTEVDALAYVAQHLDILDPTSQPSKGQGSQVMEVWLRISVPDGSRRQPLPILLPRRPVGETCTLLVGCAYRVIANQTLCSPDSVELRGVPLSSFSSAGFRLQFRYLKTRSAKSTSFSRIGFDVWSAA